MLMFGMRLGADPAYRGNDDAAARDVKPHLSGERRTRLQHSWHRTYKMDI